MATLKRRATAEGERFRVEFREGGRGGIHRQPTFSSESEALRFKQLVEALGNVMPDDQTLIRQGFAFLLSARPAGMTHTAMSLVEYARAFIATRDKAGENQKRRYHRYVDLYLEPFFGDRRIQTVQRAHLRAWQQWMTGEATLSAKTVANVRGLLVPMFAAACRRGEYGEPALLAYSPIDGLDCPRVVTARRAILRSAEHAALFFTIAYELDPDFAELLDVTAHLACRFGEVIGLCDDVVHLGARPSVEIRRVGVQIRGTGWRLRDYPKTAAGFRELPITAAVAGILAARMARGVGLLFPGPTGDLYPVGQNMWRKRWQPIMVEARRRGLPYNMTIQGLRKTTLSVLADSGIGPVTLKEFAGHESAVTTLDIYTEANGAHRDTLLTNISGFLPKAG